MRLLRDQTGQAKSENRMVIYDQYPFLPLFWLLGHFYFRIDHKFYSESIASGLLLSSKLSLAVKSCSSNRQPDSHWIAPNFATPGLLRSKVPPDLRLLFRGPRSISRLFRLKACTRKPLPGAVAKDLCGVRSGSGTALILAPPKGVRHRHARKTDSYTE